jgi:SAM-dependent methyltransferase
MFINGLRHDSHCRVCQSNEIETLYKLNDTPLEDQFVKSREIDQPVYPLELALCNQCDYVFLPYIVNPDVSYSDYIYNSSITAGLNNHFDQYALDIITTYSISKGMLAVDLGSNDGSMLASLSKAGMEVLGVEPASSIAKIANDAGLPTVNDYFTKDVVSEIIKSRGKASLITANYMYANIDNLVKFTECVKELLAEDGIFVVQTGYHPEQMKIGMFDYIYHEHFSYFTVSVLYSLFAKAGLELIDASLHKPKGGSLRVVAQHAGAERKRSETVDLMVESERAVGTSMPDFYTRFYEKVMKEKNRLTELLEGYKSQGSKIIGFGASHSTTTLIYHFELAQYLDCIVDDNPDKHDTYSPGAHIPVYSGEYLLREKPECILVLAWQHKNSILNKYQSLTEGCNWVMPFTDFNL